MAKQMQPSMSCSLLCDGEGQFIPLRPGAPVSSIAYAHVHVANALGHVHAKHSLASSFNSLET